MVNFILDEYNSANAQKLPQNKSLNNTQKLIFEEIRKRGGTVAEAFYVAAGRNPLNVLGTKEMINREKQKIFDTYKDIVQVAYDQHKNKKARKSEIGTWTHTDARDAMIKYIDSMGIAQPQKNSKKFMLSNNINMMPYIDGIAVEQNFDAGIAISKSRGARPDLVVFTGSAYNRMSNKKIRPKANMRVGDIRDIKTGNARFSQKQKNKNVTNVTGFARYVITVGNQEAVRPK